MVKWYESHLMTVGEGKSLEVWLQTVDLSLVSPSWHSSVYWFTEHTLGVLGSGHLVGTAEERGRGRLQCDFEYPLCQAVESVCRASQSCAPTHDRHLLPWHIAGVTMTAEVDSCCGSRLTRAPVPRSPREHVWFLILGCAL